MDDRASEKEIKSMTNKQKVREDYSKSEREEEKKYR